MLVLSRQIGESITVTGPDGTTIKLMVVEIRGQRMRIGIQAPKDWKILREELPKETAK